MPKLSIVGLLLLAAAGLLRTVAPAGAASATLSISPATVTVDPGASFSIAAVQSTDVTTTGAQTDVTFDPSILQVVGVDKGAAYSGASLVIGVAPQTAAEAIAEANTTGTLQNVSAFYLPGAGSVPAGATDFVVLQMQTRPAFGGISPITLNGVEMLDSIGDPVPVTLNSGEVTVNGPTAAPTPTPDPNATPSPSPLPTPTPSPSPVPTPTPEPQAFIKVMPPSLAVPPGSTFTINLTQTANFVTTGAQAELSFNPSLLQVTKVERGAPYQRASLIYGEVPNTGEAAIAEANSTGKLRNIATFFVPGTGSIPAGDATFVKLTFTAGSTEGKSPLTLAKLEMLNEGGEELVVGGTDGEITVDVDAPPPATPLGAASPPRALPGAGGPADPPVTERLSRVLMALGLISVAGGLVTWHLRRT